MIAGPSQYLIFAYPQEFETSKSSPCVMVIKEDDITSGTDRGRFSIISNLITSTTDVTVNETASPGPVGSFSTVSVTKSENSPGTTVTNRDSVPTFTLTTS